MWQRLARRRVSLGFVVAAVALWLVQPTPASLAVGIAIAVVGEGLRLWAAGHIDKGREITTSGPYRFVRHPLYLGSTVLAVGFVVASRSWPVALIATVYLALTLAAAIRTEEAALDARFEGQYTAYREGRLADTERRFRWARVRRNREHRAVVGLAVVTGLFLVRVWW